MPLTRRRRLLIAYACALVGQFLILSTGILRRRRRVQRVHRHVKINRFYEDIIACMTDRTYRHYMRMNRETFDRLCTFVYGIPRMNEYMTKSRIEFRKIIAMTCVYLGNQMTTMALSILFGVNEETFLRCTKVVLYAIVDRISDLISWPNRSEYRRIARKFNDIGKEYFPNVIGALDGCHLHIELTEEKIDDLEYRNYHQWYSIILLAITTYDLSFIQIHVGWPGKAHDHRVWQNTDTWYSLDNYLADGRRSLIESYHIVADSAFPCRKHLMACFKSPVGQDLDVMRRNFNRCLASKRQNVERSFGLLKKRFPRIVKLNQKTSEKKVVVVMAACALHNICIQEKDNINYFLSAAEQQRRIHWPNLPIFSEEDNKRIGVYKRDLLARALFTG